MRNSQTFEDTICAISSPLGMGAIALIRVSGKNAFAITQKIFSKKIPTNVSHKAYFGEIKDAKGNIVDQVVLTIFGDNKSFTGESTVEIACHGSTFIQQKILQLLIQMGCRVANPGEFTLRAYLQGKMDLSQAEAVADLIASDTAQAHRVALDQMKGGVSKDLFKLREELINLAALIELELDFSQEDVEFADRGQLFRLLQNLKTHCKTLIKSFEYGNSLKDGIPVAILGKPNAGKSSLLNALLGEEKAIVSEIAGTTRDIIEDILIIDGVKFRLIDTAGLRETSNKIEVIGIKKAYEKALIAKIILYLFDGNNTSSQEVLEEVKSLYRKDVVIFLVQTKIDIPQSIFFSENQKQDLKIFTKQFLKISLTNQKNIYLTKLQNCLSQQIQKNPVCGEVILTNIRHVEAITNILKQIKCIEKGLKNKISEDIISLDIRQAIYYISLIVGEVELDRDILGAIFGKFCIGK